MSIFQSFEFITNKAMKTGYKKYKLPLQVTVGTVSLKVCTSMLIQSNHINIDRQGKPNVFKY